MALQILGFQVNKFRLSVFARSYWVKGKNTGMRLQSELVEWGFYWRLGGRARLSISTCGAVSKSVACVLAPLWTSREAAGDRSTEVLNPTRTPHQEITLLAFLMSCSLFISTLTLHLLHIRWKKRFRRKELDLKGSARVLRELLSLTGSAQGSGLYSWHNKSW